MNCLTKFSNIKRGNERVDNKGYSYAVEDEKILEYMKLSTEQKLQWLEEINAFTFSVLSDQEKLIRNKLRAGEI